MSSCLLCVWRSRSVQCCISCLLRSCLVAGRAANDHAQRLSEAGRSRRRVPFCSHKTQCSRPPHTRSRGHKISSWNQRWRCCGSQAVGLCGPPKQTPTDKINPFLTVSHSHPAKCLVPYYVLMRLAIVGRLSSQDSM